MGSFNASCAVSKCSINPGDRVKLIPIVSRTSIHPDFDSTMHLGFGCYTYDYFQFLGYPMDATYADYGNFEIVENDVSEYNLSIIKKNYTQSIPPEDEDVSSYDRNGYNTTANDLNWEVIGNMIHFGSLFLDSSKDMTKRKFLGYFPVHESVYNLFMECTPAMYFDESYTNVPFVKYLKKQMEKYIGVPDEFEADITKYMDLYSSKIGTVNKSGVVVTPEDIYDRAVAMAEYRQESNDERKDYSYSNSSNVKKICKFRELELKKEIDEEFLRSVVSLDAELSFLIMGLSAYNIPILPPMTAGQEYDKTDHAAFLIRMGQEMMNLQKTDNKENYDEDELVLKPVIKNYFEVSMSGLVTGAKNDWKPERGKENLVLIEKFIAEYPEGVYLTMDELQKSGYISILSGVESTMLDFLFINDTVKE